MNYFIVGQMGSLRYIVWGDSAKRAIARARSYWGGAFTPLYAIKVTPR